MLLNPHVFFVNTFNMFFFFSAVSQRPKIQRASIGSDYDTAMWDTALHHLRFIRVYVNARKLGVMDQTDFGMEFQFGEEYQCINEQKEEVADADWKRIPGSWEQRSYWADWCKENKRLKGQFERNQKERRKKKARRRNEEFAEPAPSVTHDEKVGSSAWDYSVEGNLMDPIDAHWHIGDKSLGITTPLVEKYGSAADKNTPIGMFFFMFLCVCCTLQYFVLP